MRRQRPNRSQVRSYREALGSMLPHWRPLKAERDDLTPLALLNPDFAPIPAIAFTASTDERLIPVAAMEPLQ